MNPDQLVLPIVRHIGQRPRLSDALFKFAKYNPFDPQRFSWPYPVYDKMSDGRPVVYSRLFKDWTVFGYDEVLDVLRSPNVSTSGVITRLCDIAPYTKLSPQAMDNFARWLLFLDPPDHTRLRNAVSRSFTPKRIAEHETRVRTITEQLLTDLANDPNPDIIAGFASPLPVYVIADILGVPSDEFESLHRGSSEIAGLLEIMQPFDPDSISERFAELHDTFTALIEQRRREPRDDLITALATDPDSELDDDDIIAVIVVLMFAGHETTTGLLGNTFLALAKFPDQRSLLREQPDLIDNAVEEFLRYDPPAQIGVRTTTGPVQAGSTTIPKGVNVALMIGAANRDTRRWPDADQLCIDRRDPKPLSFGHGIHHCLGGALTRLEMRTAIPAFLDSFGDYTINRSSLAWKQSTTLRGPTTLEVERERRVPRASVE
ncbi:MAG: cytochrome P450 [Acidimicrobiia bacterium]|nr:cytochrome P450 [Acidimicrobiia bacterium]